MADQGDTKYIKRLGAELRNRRLARGMSLRGLAKELGLSGHGTLVDYEHGRRIPPEDLIEGCERVLQVSDGALRNLREKALAERANQQSVLLLQEPEPVPQAAAELPSERPRRHLRPPGRGGLTVLLVAAVVVAGLSIGAWRLTAATGSAAARPAASPTSRTAVAGWGICWGSSVGRIQPTDLVMSGGADSLQVTVTKPQEAGDFAVCTHHGLGSVHPGTKVTVLVRASASGVGSGLGFFVYDSHYTATWAPETPKGYHAPIPTGTGWRSYVWTVPKVDEVITMGVEMYSTTDQPLIVWLGAVNW